MKRNRSIVKLAFERDAGRCRNCSEPATAAHHVIPLAFGGTDALSNLVCLCDACHYAAHRGMAVTHVKNTLDVGAKSEAARTQAYVSVGGTRDRQGRQLAIVLDPELLQELKQYATNSKTTVASTVSDFIAAGLQGTQCTKEDSIDGRLAWLESQVFRLITSSVSASTAEED